MDAQIHAYIFVDTVYHYRARVYYGSNFSFLCLIETKLKKGNFDRGLEAPIFQINIKSDLSSSYNKIVTHWGQFHGGLEPHRQIRAFSFMGSWNIMVKI